MDALAVCVEGGPPPPRTVLTNQVHHESTTAEQAASSFVRPELPNSIFSGRGPVSPVREAAAGTRTAAYAVRAAAVGWGPRGYSEQSSGFQTVIVLYGHPILYKLVGNDGL